MSAYAIFNYNILDRNKIDELTERITPINEKYGAEVIVGSPVKTLEGEALSSMVIYKFKDFQSAQDWYHSIEHRELTLFRNEITEGWATIVPDVNETEALIDSGYFET